MIHAVLVFNTSGVPRITKFYTPLRSASQPLLRKIFGLISSRPASLCNFLDAPELRSVLGSIASQKNGKNGRVGVASDEVGVAGSGDDVRVVYRNYATLYFVFVVDGAESELGILDLIQVFVESLDRVFENVCELDLVFHFDEVHHILAELIQGGLVLETNVDEISEAVRAASHARKTSFHDAHPLALSSGSGPRSSGLQTSLGWLTDKLASVGNR